MTTKTTTPSVAEKAEATRQRFEEAQNTLLERRRALQGAHARVESIRRSWERGDDSITAAEKVEADADIARLTALVSAAERQSKMAERALVTSTPKLAEAVAEALGDSLYGVEAIATSERPKVPSKITAPKVYVLQARPHEHNERTGDLSGQCFVIVHAPKWAADLEDFWTTLSKSGRITLGHGYRQEPHPRIQGDVKVTEVEVRPASALPITPEFNGEVFSVPAAKPDAVSARAARIAEGLSAKTEVTPTGAAFRAPSIEPSHQAKVVSQRIDKAGNRTAVIRVSLSIGNGGNRAIQTLRAAIERLAGETFGGGGHVSEVRDFASDQFTTINGRPDGRRVSADVVLVSQTVEHD